MTRKDFAIILLCVAAITVSARAFGTTYFVSTNGANQAPYTNWLHAALVIQDAIDLAADGDSVLVSNGVYRSGSRITQTGAPPARVAISNNILLQSINGPDVTAIAAGASNDFRGVHMTAGTIAGFEVSGGYTFGWPVSYGAGILAPGGIVSNCIVKWNFSALGAGICSGTVYNCTILRNDGGRGGGAYGATLIDSTICSNYAVAGGGGLYDCVASNCIIFGNFVDWDGQSGGGAATSVLFNCFIATNSARSGGGISGSRAKNCVIINNSAFYSGGVSGGSIEGCLVASNRSEKIAGGVSRASVIGCTIVSNKCTWHGAGGIAYCVVSNSIVLDNRGTVDANVDYIPHNYGHPFGETNFSFSCTYPDPGGTGNTTNDPRFMDVTNGDFRLRFGSPCIDTGTNLTDLHTDPDGRVRPIDGDADGLRHWDMGCYEYDPAKADGDGDGLSSMAELSWDGQPGYNPATDLDPTLTDTDGDGVADLIEIAAGSDPLNEASHNNVTLDRLSSDQSDSPSVSWWYYPNTRSVDITYQIERSTDLDSWQQVGTHLSSGDTTGSAQFDDNSCTNGHAFYRLRLTSNTD